MAEPHKSPWTLTSHPVEVAACASAGTYGITRQAWGDPELADLLAPPVTVTIAVGTAQKGRYRTVFAQPLRQMNLPTRRDPAGVLAPV
jgi:hypothetical protein